MRVPTLNVIADLALPSQQFELGRILEMEGDTSVVLETMVPLGERTVPFFRVHGMDNGFEESISGHSAVNDIHVVNTHDDEILYALDWDISADTFFEGLVEAEANLLEARGVADTWTFELRFQSHDALSSFRAHCTEHAIPIDVRRLYNPTKPSTGPWYGMLVIGGPSGPANPLQPRRQTSNRVQRPGPGRGGPPARTAR